MHPWIVTAKVFRSGNSQAVRIPHEFQFDVDEVELLRRGHEIVLRKRPQDLGRAFDLLAGMPLSADAAEHCGRMRTEPGRRGTPIGGYDLPIAAQARSLELILVSNNEREFWRVPGLRIENWAVK